MTGLAVLILLVVAVLALLAYLDAYYPDDEVAERGRRARAVRR